MANNRNLILVFLLLSYFSYSTIIITQPAVTNFTKNQIQYWFANFGTVHYNKPLNFDIFVSNKTFCGTDQESDMKHFTSPTYVVIKQGGCLFPRKAYQAQNLGAQGIIIASKEVQYTEGNVLISDDGTGRKVSITTLFIKLQDYDKLSKLTNAKIKVNFQLTQREKSNVDLFLSGSGRQNYIFLRNFRQYYNRIKDKVRLNVVYHTIQCKVCDQKQCILQRTCCTFDLDNYKSGVGRQIIYQQFRQYQIFNYFAGKNNIDQWFQYMDRFDKRCDYNWLNSLECSKKIQNQLGISQLPLVNQFDTMSQWRRYEVKTGIISLPDIAVNGMRHVESLTSESAFQMICDSLSGQPAECMDAPPPSTGPSKAAIIATVIISSIIFIILGIFCYKRIIRRQITNDMSSKVSQLVSKYAAKVSQQKKKRKDKLMERMTEQL